MKQRLKEVKDSMSIKSNFIGSISYIAKCKYYILSVIVVFIIGSFLGFVNSENLNVLDEVIREIILRSSGLNGFEMFFFILQNNLQSAFIGLLFGVFLGFFPIVSALANGLILGYVAERVISVESVYSLWRIFPHGIFELPAVFIALGIGVRFGFSRFYSGNENNLKNVFYESSRAFLMVVAPLLILAALIEAVLIAFF